MIALIYLSMKGEVQVFGSWLRKLISDEVKSVQSAESGLTAITALHNTSNNSDPKFPFHFVENHQVISLLTFSSCIWFCRRQSFLFAHLFDQLLSECLIDWMIICMGAGKKKSPCYCYAIVRDNFSNFWKNDEVCKECRVPSLYKIQNAANCFPYSSLVTFN